MGSRQNGRVTSEDALAPKAGPAMPTALRRATGSPPSMDGALRGAACGGGASFQKAWLG